MRKIFVQFDTGYCGEDGAEVWELDDTVSDIVIDADVQSAAYDWALQWDHSPEEDYCEWADVQDRVEGYWEDYDAEKHEGMY
jgi:hypothetical protein